MIISIITIIISSNIVKLQENKYNRKYNSTDTIHAVAMITSDITEKEYSNQYVIKIIKCSENAEIEGIKFLAKTNKKVRYNFNDVIEIEGNYKEINCYENTGTFNYKEYLKTKKINGIIEINKSQKIYEKKSAAKFFNNINNYIKNKIDKLYSADASAILNALLLGNKSSLDPEIKQNFINSGLSHILAISGMHIACVTLIIKKVSDILFIDIRKKKTFIILILILYLLIIGFVVSAVRAVIMVIMSICANLIFRKSNNWINLSIASLIILIYNPYYIKDTGFLLSFGATTGILFIYPYFNKIQIQSKILKYFIEIFLIGISVNIFIFPIIIYLFKKVAFTTFISTLLMTPLVFAIEIIGLISIAFPSNIILLIVPIFETIIKIFLKIAQFNIGSIYVMVLTLTEVICYYAVIIYFFSKKSSKLIEKINKKIINYLLIIVVITELIMPKIYNEFSICFIDVGQGDSCLIKTIKNKTILIDGGGSDTYDIGENVLLPYLLNKRINNIDYLIISHFDNDHVKGLITIMKKIKINKIIIGKQFENSKNYEEFIKIVNEEKISVFEVVAGDSILIEDNTYLEILWPDVKNEVKENKINNNSLVCKIKYNDLTVMFTGDIEKKAEEAIIKKYTNKEVLKADIVKIPHHGSKTSSTKEFIKIVHPQIALIGVGKNNIFGHPNIETINTLKENNIQIYRTDINGEIIIKYKNKIKIKTYENNL